MSLVREFAFSLDVTISFIKKKLVIWPILQLVIPLSEKLYNLMLLILMSTRG